MNDEQLRTMAELVLVQNKLIANLSQMVADLAQLVIPDDDERKTKIIHHADQLSAILEKSGSSMAETRAYFGLPPEPPEPPA